jgi:hypothetical protein
VISLKSWSKKRRRHWSGKSRDCVFSYSRWQCLTRMQGVTRRGKITLRRTKRLCR